MAEEPPVDGADGEESYANIREILAPLLNQTVIEITQHDKEEWEEDGQSYVSLHFSNGYTLKVIISDDGEFGLLSPEPD
jgi:hypothetical protein